MGATDRKNEAWKQQNQTRNNQKLEGDIGVWAHGATTEPQPSQFSLLKSQAPYLWMRGRDNHPMSVPPSSETV